MESPKVQKVSHWLSKIVIREFSGVQHINTSLPCPNGESWACFNTFVHSAIHIGAPEAISKFCHVFHSLKGSISNQRVQMPPPPPPEATWKPQEIAGPNLLGLIKGNQWVFIVPDHKAGYLLEG